MFSISNKEFKYRDDDSIHKLSRKLRLAARYHEDLIAIYLNEERSVVVENLRSSFITNFNL